MRLQLPDRLQQWLFEKSEKEGKNPSKIIRDILFEEYHKDLQKR